MRYATAILALFVLLLIIGAVTPQAASAATPTPTATLKAIQPTPTSLYGYLRGTPTPLTLSTLEFNLNIAPEAGHMADQAINVYRAMNSSGIVDVVAFIFILGILVLYLVRMIASSTRIQ
jgi:hypothetical protein